MRGIDISHHNGWPFNRSTETAYQDADFVIVKATEHGGEIDHPAYFRKAIARAIKDGKLIGAYPYARGADPETEADEFLEVVGPHLGTALLGLDFEQLNNRAWTDPKWARRFVDHVYKKTDIWPLIYTGNEGVKTCANCADVCKLWFCGYPDSRKSWEVPAWPSRYKTAPWPNYTIWQYTSGGGTCDRNTTNLTRDQWLRLAAGEGKMTVRIGSARIDENGKTKGGAAGDQTGKEVSTQAWYLHTKGWIALRAKNEVIAEKLAYAMEQACSNPKIGYDQNQRGTLYAAAAKVGFDPGKVTTKCETDCSALVRVCLAYAGIKVGDFNTATEAKVIMATGDFTELSESKTKTSDYLQRGDILVTRTKGHTVIVLDDGAKAGSRAKPGKVVDEVVKVPVKKTTLQLAAEVMQGKHGSGAARKKSLGTRYTEVQTFLNHIAVAPTATLAKEVIAGKYGDADTRRIVLGKRYAAVQARVNKLIK